jgi:hypothetical protein
MKLISMCLCIRFAANSPLVIRHEMYMPPTAIVALIMPTAKEMIAPCCMVEIEEGLTI